MSCEESLVQETLDSIDEVSRCQVLDSKTSNFFYSACLVIQFSA